MSQTFDNLLKEYETGPVSTDKPERMWLQCLECRCTHNGIVMRRNGQYNYYYEVDGQAVSECPNRMEFVPVVETSVDDVAKQLEERFDLTPAQELVWQMIYRDEGLIAALDWYKAAIAGAKK